jgi:ubiquinone biosynthesis protein
LGRQLYPELNLWETAKPFLEDWLKRQYSPRNVVRQLQRDAPAFIHHASQLPEVLPQFLAVQKRMLNEPHRKEAHARDSHYWIGSGVATLVITLVANLQSHWYPIAGLCLVLLGLIRLRQ